MPAHQGPAGLLFVLPVLVAAAAGADGLNPERITAVAAMLGERPMGVGRPITDRVAWQRLAGLDSYQRVIPRAEELLTKPLPEQPDELYLEFSRNGNRTNWQRVAGDRRGRISWLALAECLQNQGRFVPELERIITALAAERTWVMPAHDRGLGNFNGQTIDIDLASSALAWNFATIEWLLGDKLTPAARQTIRESVRRFVFDPYRAMVDGERRRNWWMTTTNNWNAVCLAGVTGAALALLEDRDQRARFVVAAEEYSKNFLRGFTPDGYCSEGLGYWNYGFGHYVLLAETVRQATGGGVDLMALDEVRMPATFGARIEIINGVYPAFADCSINARPDGQIMRFVNRLYGLGLPGYDGPPVATPGALPQAMLYSFPNAASDAPAVQASGAGPGIRTWFEHAGVLIGRPSAGSDCHLGVALKGGHNAEHHNHNDVGSYVVAVGNQAVLLDPGSEVYTARTFSSRRYESKLLNSFGHPVPVVAGKLQRSGRKAAAKILATEFTDQTDTLRLDLKAAYDVPELELLERTFVYSREGTGSLTVTDRAKFSSPQTFGTAVLTDGEWRRLDDGGLLVFQLDQALRVDIAVEGDWELHAEDIHEQAKAQPTRLGIDLAAPLTEATITVSIAPMRFEGDRGETLLRNGGFELGSFAWRIPNDGISSVSDEQTASGGSSLKIDDRDRKRGSNVSSAAVPLEAGAKYVLRGQVYHVSGSGVGMYVRYYDVQGRMLNQVDAKGNMAGIGTLAGEVGQWVAFALPFETPPETTSVSVWIHSYNAAQVTAYLDDLEIVPASGG